MGQLLLDLTHLTVAASFSKEGCDQQCHLYNLCGAFIPAHLFNNVDNALFMLCPTCTFFSYLNIIYPLPFKKTKEKKMSSIRVTIRTAGKASLDSAVKLKVCAAENIEFALIICHKINSSISKLYHIYHGSAL